ncbi:MAG: peptidylprolyl isomerase [Bacteroidota bacterium]
MPAVQQGDTVKVTYKGRLDTGRAFDEATEADPLVFQVGAPGVIAGFSDAVVGMQPGERRRVRLEPAEAYGTRNEQLVFEMPRARLPERVQPGQTIQLPHSSGRQIPAIVRSIRPNVVTVDANHELAGETLFFTINLLEIVESTTAQPA